MKGPKIVTVIMLALLAVPFLGMAFAEGGHTIHPFQHGTTISRTSVRDGEKIGCLTSGTYYTLYIDFFYVDQGDNDQRINSLSFQSGDGINEASYADVGFAVTWEYSTNGGSSWNSYTGDIDVPWSGENGVGNVDVTDPHAIVRVTFPVTGSLGDKFYYRVHFSTYYHIEGNPPGNSGNHYFWYEICNGVGVPEFQMELPLMTLLGAIAVFMIRRRRSGIVGINLR